MFRPPQSWSVRQSSMQWARNCSGVECSCAKVDGQPRLTMLWSLIGFSVWHFAPQLVLPSPLGQWRFVAGSAVVGSASAMAAWRSGGLRQVVAIGDQVILLLTHLDQGERFRWAGSRPVALAASRSVEFSVKSSLERCGVPRLDGVHVGLGAVGTYKAVDVKVSH